MSIVGRHPGGGGGGGNSLIKPNSQQDMVLEDYGFKSNSANTFSLFRVLNRVFVLGRKP